MADVVKQQVAAHWDRRAAGFDDDFGHSIRTPGERAAWDRILDTGARMVVSDWVMPNIDGLELCRRVRAAPDRPYTYFILQTARRGSESFLEAMDAGVDDFVTKPVPADELKARLRVAERILGLREHVVALEGLLAVCSYCKRIRHADGGWGSLERYIEKRSKAELDRKSVV